MKVEVRNQSKMIWAWLSPWTTKTNGVRKNFGNYQYVCEVVDPERNCELLDNELLHKELSVLEIACLSEGSINLLW